MNHIYLSVKDLHYKYNVYEVYIGSMATGNALNINDTVGCPHCNEIAFTVDDSLDTWIDENFPPTGYGYQCCPEKHFECQNCKNNIPISFGDYCG